MDLPGQVEAAAAAVYVPPGRTAAYPTFKLHPELYLLPGSLLPVGTMIRLRMVHLCKMG